MQDTMTPKQALSACTKIDPKRTYCVKLHEWHHDADHQHTDYCISVLPALDGSDCEQFRSRVSFAACVAEYRAAHAAAVAE